MAKRRRRRRRATASGRVRRHRRNPVRRSKRSWHHRKGSFTYNARRRRRSTSGSTRRRGRVRHRRNPIAIRGMVGQLLEAGKHAVAIVLAQVAVGKVSNMIPIGGTSVPIQIAKQAAIGLGLAAVTRRFAPRYANDVLIAALLVPATTVLRQVPVIGTGLSGAPPGLGIWSGRPVALRGAPPGLGRGLGTYDPRVARSTGGLVEGGYYD